MAEIIRRALGAGPLTRCDVLRGRDAGPWRVHGTDHSDAIALVLATTPELEVIVSRFTWGDPTDGAEGVAVFLVEGGRERSEGWHHAGDAAWEATPLAPSVHRQVSDRRGVSELDWVDGLVAPWEPARMVGRSVAAVAVRRSGVRVSCVDGTELEVEAGWGCDPDAGFFPFTLTTLVTGPRGPTEPASAMG